MIKDIFTAKHRGKKYKIIYHDDIGWILEKPKLSYEIDVVEVAKMLKIHPESVRRLIRKNVIKARKVGNKWFVDYSYVMSFLPLYDPRPGQYFRNYDEANN